MTISIRSIVAVTLLATTLSVLAKTPENFVYTSSGDLEAASVIIARSDIGGAQIVYNWRSLEPEKDQYDFSQIEQDLARLKTAKKKLFIQIQDRFFEQNARYVPDYLMNDAQYGGGISPQFDNPGEGKPMGSGWVAQQWDPAVRHRYQALLAAIAERFDGRVYGVNLPETAVDLDEKSYPRDFPVITISPVKWKISPLHARSSPNHMWCNMLISGRVNGTTTTTTWGDCLSSPVPTTLGLAARILFPSARHK